MSTVRLFTESTGGYDRRRSIFYPFSFFLSMCEVLIRYGCNFKVTAAHDNSHRCTKALRYTNNKENKQMQSVSTLITLQVYSL